MHKLATYAKPHIEKLLLRQRAEAMGAINKTMSDIWSQYDESLSKRSKQITAATTVAFLNALKYEPDSDPNKVRGLKNGILVHERDSGFPLHVLPNQNLLFKGDTKCYFPKNTYQEDKTERVIGSSFAGAYTHKNARLNKTKTKSSHHNTHGVQFPTYKGSEVKDVYDGSIESIFKGRPEPSVSVCLACIPNEHPLSAFFFVSCPKLPFS